MLAPVSTIPQFKNKRELKRFLRSGCVNVDRWNEVSVTKFDQFFEETQQREKQLVIMPSKDGEKVQVVQCVHRLSIRAIAPLFGIQWREMQRILPNGRCVPEIPKPCKWTATGTCRRGMELTEDAIREVEEELLIKVTSEQLHLRLVQDMPEPYWSSMCPLIKTHSVISHFDLILDEPLWSEETKVIPDGDKQIVIECFPYSLPEPA